MGQAGGVFIFIFLYTALIIVGCGLFAYAARCFLVVLEGTATGNDEVAWPDEPFVDWLWRGGTLAWLLLVWLAPLGAILRVTWRGAWQEGPLLVLALGAGVLWLFFPIGVLSSLSSLSRLMFFRWRVVTGLAQKGSATLQFYAASLGVIVVGLGGWGVALLVKPAFLPVAAVLGSAALLLYARLLGRLGWILTPPKSRKKKKGPVEASALLPPPTPVETQTVPVAADDDEEDLGIEREASPPATSVVERERPRRVEGYDVVKEEEPEEKKSEKQAGELLQPLRRRVERAQGRLHLTESPRSMWRGVWEFPFYDACRQAWVKLALISLVAGFLLQQLLRGI